MFKSDNEKIDFTLFFILLSAALVPLFVVEIPALGDYLNHLARMHIITSAEQNIHLTKIYDLKWDLVPDIGMDLLVPFLTKFFGVFLSGKIFIILIILLLTTGIYAIHYSIYREFSLAPLVAFLFLFNHSLLIGLLNYLLGMGIAFWAIAIWIGLREHNPVLRISVSFVFVILLFICHLYGVGLYGLAILCYELWRLREKKEKNPRALLTDTLVFALPFIVIIFLMLFSPTGGIGHEIFWKPFRTKFQAIEWIIELYNIHLDRLIGAIIVGVSLWSLGKGLLRFHPVGKILLVTGTIIFIVMPNIIFGSGDADFRFPIAIVFLSIAFSYWKLPKTSYRAIFIAAVVVLVAIRFIGVGKMWTRFDRDYAEFRQSFTHIEPGSTLLTIWARYPKYPYINALPINYTNCIAVIDRSVFSPSIFTKKGHQILTVKKEYEKINNKPFYFYVNDIVEADENPEGQLNRGGQYWKQWKDKFDYLLVLYTNDNDVNPLPNSLELKYKGASFQLYLIKQSA